MSKITIARAALDRAAIERWENEGGTHAAVPDIPGMATSEPLAHVVALELRQTR